MQNAPRMSPLDTLYFYFDYFVRKTIYIWFEVRRPKLKLFLYEMCYSLMKFWRHDSMFRSPFSVDMVETVFGTFRIRPRTADMASASPAFERRDLECLLGHVERLLVDNRRVLFLDIGADLGTFIVSVLNRHKGNPRLQAMAFEPAPSSFMLLSENIHINGLDAQAQCHNVPLYDADGAEMTFVFNVEAPGSSGLHIAGGPGGIKVSTRTLDGVLGQDGLSGFDALVVKMDVEGVESQVLEGARKSLAFGGEVILMVEDFVNPAVLQSLEALGARFLCRLTPYNSFWSISSSPKN